MLAFIPPSSCHITPSLFTEKKQRLREVTAPCRLPDESKNHIWDWEGKTISERELELGSDSVLVGPSVAPSSGGQLPGQGVGGDPRKVFCHRGFPGRGQELKSVGVQGSGSHRKGQNLQHMVGGGGGIWSGKGIQVCITGASSAELGD